MKLRALPLVALFSAAAIAAASLQAVSIKWNPKEGATYKYKMEAKMNFGQEIPVTGMITNKIEKVTDEKVTISIKSSVEAMGTTMDSTSTDTLSRSGETLESKTSADTQGADLRRLMQASAFIYPGNDVKVGETWVHKVKKNEEKGIFSSETTFKYEGTEEVDGVKCHKITSQFKETDAETNASAANTFWISIDDTEQYKSTNSVKSCTVAPGTAIDMEATTVRVK